MTNNKRLTNEELTQIKERAEKANNGNYLLSPEVISYMYDSVDDVPKLLSEIERLKAELSGDGVLTLPEQVDHARLEIRRLGGLVGHYKGYADRFSDDIPEYKNAIRNLDALAESTRLEIGDANTPQWLANEIVGIISELERKVGEIT